MTRAEYNRFTEKELRGRKVKTTAVLSNGYGIVPIGTVGEITGKQGGLSLTTEACPHCGVRMFISKVVPEYVELI